MLQVIRRKPMFGFFVGLAGGLAATLLSVPLLSRAPLDADRLAEFTVHELIEALPHEAGAEIGPASFWADPFETAEETPPAKRGAATMRRPIPSPVLMELVRRGARVLPDLIDHLDDGRPTEFRVRLPAGSEAQTIRFAAEYDSRRADAAQVSSQREIASGLPLYRLKVGDLCFLAIGQIVNRKLDVVRWHPAGALVQSPIETPDLAAAVKRDWAGLTTAEHERSLLQDTGHRSKESADAALARLHFYYPDTHRAYVHDTALLIIAPDGGHIIAARWVNLADGLLLTRRPN